MNTINQLLATYVGHMMDRIDTSGLSDEERQSHARRLHEELAVRVGVVILEALTPQDRQEYVDRFVATEQQDSPQAQKFLQDRLPQMTQVINAGAEEFAAEYFAAVQQ